MNPGRRTSNDPEAFLRSIRLCYWRVLNGLDALLEAYGLTARQFLVIQSLGEEGPANSQTLCRRLSVTPAEITQLSGRLERKRYLRRRPSAQDRRQAILELTPQGGAVLRQARGRREAFVRTLLDTLPTGRRTTMLSSLEALVNALEAGGGPSRPTSRSRREPQTPR